MKGRIVANRRILRRLEDKPPYLSLPVPAHSKEEKG